MVTHVYFNEIHTSNVWNLNSAMITEHVMAVHLRYLEQDLSALDVFQSFFSCWMASAPELFAAIFAQVFFPLCQNNNTTEILKIHWQGQTAYTTFGKKRKNRRRIREIQLLPPSPWSLTPPPHLDHLLPVKRTRPWTERGWWYRNEDEYSAALERLLEGCPACTRCSSQIGGKGGRGPTHWAEVGKLGGGSQWRWLGWQTGRACLCAPLADETAMHNLCLHTHMRTDACRHQHSAESVDRSSYDQCGKYRGLTQLGHFVFIQFACTNT